jgi:adenosylcobinamide-phosphate synthase
MSDIFIICSLAVLLDWLLGEPKRFHPLVGFGKIASWLENRLNKMPSEHHRKKIFLGFCAVFILLVPISYIAYLVSLLPFWGEILSLIAVTLCIGHKSLHDHTLPIANALNNNDHATARLLTSRIVSRDPDALDIPKATIESILENGSDSIFAALFWFIVGGIPGILAYRLANTLDAMWGYKTDRYLYFGRFAARLDDLLNFIPARLTALSYCLLGATRAGVSSWVSQAKYWDSPNAGPVMAAGAGALQIELGGDAKYHGKWRQRPTLGSGQAAQTTDIFSALKLIRQCVFLWLSVLFIASVIHIA